MQAEIIEKARKELGEFNDKNHTLEFCIQMMRLELEALRVRVRVTQ